MSQAVQTVDDLGAARIEALLSRFGLAFEIVAAGASIPGSFWGEPEAGVIASKIYVRPDTPVHSLLHEACHVICMDAERRAALDTNAGGDDLEEAAVCYLQILLADELQGVGRESLMRDMDLWGYSFRLGSTLNWFRDDAADAREWLLQHSLIDAGDSPRFRLRC